MHYVIKEGPIYHGYSYKLLSAFTAGSKAAHGVLMHLEILIRSQMKGSYTQDKTREDHGRANIARKKLHTASGNDNSGQNRMVEAMESRTRGGQALIMVENKGFLFSTPTPLIGFEVLLRF
ncbi:hypothetical protein JTE90_006368 [Oedothorax gibbosus]|uniref:Uncharacterized protein n=1 Tax=Oedothorax gibbosus TaxID=931172 RepID=A0AAV6VYZ8_9ARAC|nr:hypothetical protein JTE90_006368 [Oedothorax gibbosus]